MLRSTQDAAFLFYGLLMTKTTLSASRFLSLSPLSLSLVFFHPSLELVQAAGFREQFKPSIKVALSWVWK